MQIDRSFRLIVLGWLFVAPGLAQQSSQARPSGPISPADQKIVSEAMTELKTGKVDLFGVRVLSRTGTVEAIPDLEKAFANTNDTVEKMLVAAVLVRLKDADGSYWDLLANSVEHLLSIDEPDLFAYDAQGKLIPGPSAEFKAWAKAKQLDESTAEQDAMRTHPGEVLYLGLAEDVRAVPLLRRALASRNYFVEANAARGLAALGDVFSVSLIIHAASVAPADAAELIAQSLVYFDRAEAQNALESFVNQERVKGLREERAKGMKPIP